jgi:hypothetical protein
MYPKGWMREEEEGARTRTPLSEAWCAGSYRAEERGAKLHSHAQLTNRDGWLSCLVGGAQQRRVECWADLLFCAVRGGVRTREMVQ